MWKHNAGRLSERVSVPCGKPDINGKPTLSACSNLLFVDAHTLAASGSDGNILIYETNPAKLLELGRSLR